MNFAILKAITRNLLPTIRDLVATALSKIRGVNIVGGCWLRDKQVSKGNFVTIDVMLYGEPKTCWGKKHPHIKMGVVAKDNYLELVCDIKSGERLYSNGINIPAKYVVITRGVI